MAAGLTHLHKVVALTGTPPGLRLKNMEKIGGARVRSCGPPADEGLARLAESISVVVNGKNALVPAGTTMTQLLQHYGRRAETVVVQVNEEILEKSQYDNTLLRGGERVEVVHLVGGG